MAEDKAKSSPAPSRASKQSTPKSQAKSIDIGKAIGAFDQASVRQKLALWHTTGGGVVTDDNQVVDILKDEGEKEDSKDTKEDDKKESEPSASHARCKSAGPTLRDATKTPKKAKDVVAPPLEPMSAPAKPTIVERRPAVNRIDTDVRDAVAPKKRIVSDGAWVRKRPPPPPPPEPKVEKPKPPTPPPPEPPKQYAWIRPNFLPKPKEPEPPSPPKPPPNVRVYQPRTRPIVNLDAPYTRDSSDRTLSASEGSDSELSRDRTADWRNSLPRPIVRDEEPDKTARDAAMRAKRLSRLKQVNQEYPRSVPTDLGRTTPQLEASAFIRDIKSAPHSRRAQSIEPEERPRRVSGRKTQSHDLRSEYESHGDPQVEMREAEEAVYERRRLSRREDASRHVSDDELRTRSNTVRRKPQYQEQDTKAGAEDQPRQVHGTRVEAWLHGTSDPFGPASAPSVASSRPARRNFSFEPSERGDDSTIITESTSQPIEVQRRRKPSSRRESRDQQGKAHSGDRADSAYTETEVSTENDPVVEVEYESTVSSASLRRAGARRGTRSPTKERPKSMSIVESEVASSAVSSVEESAFVPPDAPARHSALAFPNRRLFVGGGKRLSTIASVETFDSRLQQPPARSVYSDDSQGTQKPEQDEKHTEVSQAASLISEAQSGQLFKTGLSRKLTKHSDLMSVLSIPDNKGKSIVSARSIRTHKSRLATATIPDLMAELAADEIKYAQELKTLADGVIVALLKCVLSKTDAALAASLYSRKPTEEDVANATDLVRRLGVVLTRLNTLHKRIPKDDAEAFMNWAPTALKVYTDYVNTWRMGFEDVVVSLASEEDGASSVSFSPSRPGGLWDGGLPRNADGYIVDATGERVDVAFLLKRPLVRLKCLTKTIKGIDMKQGSEKSKQLKEQYEQLMGTARDRVNREKARTEDEAAAAIDATRARDLRSLAPLAGVRIDATRCVQARDYFDLHLHHSSGQAVDCKVEFLIRDNGPGKAAGGDLLICEIDEIGRWLLFPPITTSLISARQGELDGEMVVMIRGKGTAGEEWQELLQLFTDEPGSVSEWLEMLGSQPIPPALTNQSAFPNASPRRPPSSYGSSIVSSSTRTESTMTSESAISARHEVQVPIGEKAGKQSRRWSHHTPEQNRNRDRRRTSPITPPSDERPEFQHQAYEYQTGTPTGYSTARPIRKPVPVPKDTEPVHDSHPPKARPSRYRPSPDNSPRDQGRQVRGDATRGSQLSSNSSLSYGSGSSGATSSSQRFGVWMPSTIIEGGDSDSEEESHTPTNVRRSSREYQTHSGAHHGRTASAPVSALQTPPKAEHDRRSDPRSRHSMQYNTREEPNAKSPSVSPITVQKRSPRQEKDEPPTPPTHKSSPGTLKASSTPRFTPGGTPKRRSSSPLKHEYQPSSESENSFSSDDSASNYDQDYYTTDTEDELGSNDGSSLYRSYLPPRQDSLHAKVPGHSTDLTPEPTLKPSDSASQGPYRKVPEQSDHNANAKAIASVFTWSNLGDWEPLFPADCTVIIGPGTIAAYIKEGDPSRGKLTNDKPLVALELTPLVPIRRGTALDISIRSPPTAASQLHPGSNIMFRSRTQEECEILYAHINKARINNPTYIALQNARPPEMSGNWSGGTDRQGQGLFSGKGWFGLNRSKSYRARNRATSASGHSVSSINTISSVMQAMRRFSGTSKLLQRDSTEDSDSLRQGDGSRSPPTFVDPAKMGAMADSLGITSAKIRLYLRQTKGKWIDLGSARLSVLQTKGDGDSDAGVKSPFALHTGLEKRIVVTSKAGEVMLDATLGESCFERIARTGIAVSVWEDAIAGGRGVAATGGVAERRMKVYMIQLKNERECAFTFSLLGKFRY